jgi:hypothetical protein
MFLLLCCPEQERGKFQWLTNYLLISLDVPVQVVRHTLTYALHKVEKRAAERVISALASSIRGNWRSEVRDRLYEIQELVQDHFSDMGDWIEWLDDQDNWDAAVDDGREMRYWPGPYGDQCTKAELKMFGLSKYVLGDCWEDHIEKVAKPARPD